MAVKIFVIGEMVPTEHNCQLLHISSFLSELAAILVGTLKICRDLHNLSVRPSQEEGGGRREAMICNIFGQNPSMIENLKSRTATGHFAQNYTSRLIGKSFTKSLRLAS